MGWGATSPSFLQASFDVRVNKNSDNHRTVLGASVFISFHPRRPKGGLTFAGKDEEPPTGTHPHSQAVWEAGVAYLSLQDYSTPSTLRVN